MRKQQIENAAYDVATQVRAVEDTIDAALTQIAELQARMVRVRTVSRMGVSNSQAAFEQLIGSLEALIAARGGMARCHAELAEAKRFIPGLRTVSWGDAEECPEEEQAKLPDLRIVA